VRRACKRPRVRVRSERTTRRVPDAVEETRIAGIFPVTPPWRRPQASYRGAARAERSVVPPIAPISRRNTSRSDAVSRHVDIDFEATSGRAPQETFRVSSLHMRDNVGAVLMKQEVYPEEERIATGKGTPGTKRGLHVRGLLCEVDQVKSLHLGRGAGRLAVSVVVLAALDSRCSCRYGWHRRRS
jgi:hypothetical protein